MSETNPPQKHLPSFDVKTAIATSPSLAFIQNLKFTIHSVVEVNLNPPVYRIERLHFGYTLPPTIKELPALYGHFESHNDSIRVYRAAQTSGWQQDTFWRS